MAAKVFWLLNTAAASPNFFGNLQEDGSAPTAANSTYGWTIGTNANDYWRGRMGASAAATTSSTSSYISGASSPTKGTGATNTTAGDSFRTPNALSGTISGSTGTWTFDFVLRSTTAGSINVAINMRMWASASADGTTSPRDIFGGVVQGASVSLSPANTNVNSQITFPASSVGTVTLNNEFLFFQIELQNVSAAGGSSGTNCLFRIGSAKITTADFTPAGPSGSGAPTEAADSAVGGGAGTVRWNATGSPTEGSDTAAATGTIRWVATGAPTEGSDTAAAAGSVRWDATGAATEGADTAAGNGTVQWFGAGAAIEDSDTAAGAGTLVSAEAIGSGGPVEDGDTAASSGTVSGVAGTGAAIEAADTAAAAGALSWSASGAAIEGSDTADATGTTRWVAVGAASEAGDSASGAGFVIEDIVGAGNAIEGMDVVNGAGQVTGEGEVIPPQPELPPPGGAGGGGRPLYRRIPLKRRRKRKRDEEELPPPEVVEVVIPTPPQLPLVAGLPQLIIPAPVARLVTQQNVRVVEVDEDEDEVALLLEIL